MEFLEAHDLHGSKSPMEPSEQGTVLHEDVVSITPKMAHDSMVTVRLSEPADLQLNPLVDPKENTQEEEEPDENPPDDAFDRQCKAESQESSAQRDSVVTSSSANGNDSHPEELQERDSHSDSIHSSDDEDVNWEELEKTEDQQAKDDETDNVKGTPSPW